MEDVAGWGKKQTGDGKGVAMIPKQGTMQELWDTLLHYLKKCNKVTGEPTYKLVVTATPEKTLYSVISDDVIHMEDADLEKVAVWLKIYTSWED